MKSIQNYCDKAIKDHSYDVKLCRKRIMAIYFIFLAQMICQSMFTALKEQVLDAFGNEPKQMVMHLVTIRIIILCLQMLVQYWFLSLKDCQIRSYFKDVQERRPKSLMSHCAISYGSYAPNLFLWKGEL